MGNCCARNRELPPMDFSIHLVCDESMLKSTMNNSFRLSHYETPLFSKK